MYSVYVRGAFLADESNIRRDRGQRGRDGERQQHPVAVVRSSFTLFAVAIATIGNGAGRPQIQLVLRNRDSGS